MQGEPGEAPPPILQYVLHRVGAQLIRHIDYAVRPISFDCQGRQLATVWILSVFYINSPIYSCIPLFIHSFFIPMYQECARKCKSEEE